MKLALRSLLRAPSVLVSAVFCLALGIGVNAATLDVLDRILLRAPAHVQDASSIKRLYFRKPEADNPQSVVSYPMFADLAGRTPAFSDLAAFSSFDASLGLGPEAQKVRAALATPSFFPLLGVQPARGRLFSAAEGDPERPEPVALLSWHLWQRSFGSAPEILGKVLTIEGQPFTVVGILPRGFTGIDLEAVDLWLPIGAAGPLGAGPGWPANRNHFFLFAVGRLQPGVSIEQAAHQATVIHRRVYAGPGDRSATQRAVMLYPLQWGRIPESSQSARLMAWLAAGSTAVLLIACANVASLLIVRGLERRREMAVRLALGASRAAVARLLLAEGVLVALLGGLAAYAALVSAGAVLRTLLLPKGESFDRAPDLRQIAILAALSLAAGLLSGLGAALWGSREKLVSAVRSGSRDRGPGQARLRTVLLVSEVAFTFLLLVGAGLFLRSLRNIQNLALGLEPERVLVVTTNLAGAGYGPTQIDAFYRRALDRVRGMPGVEHACLAAGVPFRSSFGAPLTIPGRGDISGIAPGGIYFNAVTDDYFSTLGTPLLQGRALTAQDGAGSQRVAVINSTMATLLWPGQDPLGRCFRALDPSHPCITVVGITADARRSALREPPAAQFYVPLTQAPEWMTSRALFVRGVHPDLLAATIRREMQRLDPNLPLVETDRLSDLLEPQVRPWRLGMKIFTGFGLLALALAVLGISVAVARAVASRTEELGIRMALGARFQDLLWPVMKLGLVPAAAGIALGLVLTAGLGRRVEPLLFEVSPQDPRTLTAAAVAVLVPALLASLLPALRAKRLDPARVMRIE